MLFWKKIKSHIPVFRNAILYFGGSIMQMLLGIITSPIFAQNLTAEEFGIIGYYKSLANVIFPLTILSLNYYYMMRYYRQDEKDNNRLLESILIFLTLFNIIVLSTLYFGLYIYLKASNSPIHFFPFAAITLLALFLDVYKTFILIKFKVRKEAFKYFLIVAISTILNVGFSLLLVVNLKQGAAGRMLGPLISSLFIAGYIIYSLKKVLSFKLDKKLISIGLKFSWPMLISAYLYLPMSNIDKLFVAKIGDISELGYYSLGFSFAEYVFIAGRSLMSAIEPDIIRNIIAGNKRKVSVSISVYVISILLMTLIFMLFSDKIVGFLTSYKYTRAYIYSNYFAIGFFIMNLALIPNAYIIAFEKAKFMLYINLISGALGLAVFYIFINKWLFMGGCYAKILVAVIFALTQSIFVLNAISKNKKR